MTAHTVPVAASAAVAAVLTGPPRTVRVRATVPTAVHVTTSDPDCPALCLCTPQAVRLPYALVGTLSLDGIAVDDIGRVGGGTLTLDPLAVRVARWWRPPRPGGLAVAGADLLRRASAALRAAVPDPFPDEQARLVRALGEPTGAGLWAAVSALLGRGPGLTPLGDDVLAGALVTLTALDAPAGPRLTAVVRGAAPMATTSVSAALLHHAARGECVPQLDALLTAVRVGPPSALAAALAGVLAVGHTSGTGLVAGVAAGLAAAPAGTRTGRPGPVPAGGRTRSGRTMPR